MQFAFSYRWTTVKTAIFFKHISLYWHGEADERLHNKKKK